MQVNLMTSFNNSASFPDSLAIAKESGLTIGSIDEIQKLHIRAVPMGEQARRLAHQESSHTFLVTTSSEPSSMCLHSCHWRATHAALCWKAVMPFWLNTSLLLPLSLMTLSLREAVIKCCHGNNERASSTGLLCNRKAMFQGCGCNNT